MLKLTCRGCGAVIVAGGAPRAPVERDPFAPAEDDSLEPLPPEPSESPDAEHPPFDPFAELAEAARGTRRPAPGGPSPAAPLSEADSAFADLARALGEAPELVHP